MMKKVGLLAVSVGVSSALFAAAPLTIRELSVQKVESSSLVIDYTLSDVQPDVEDYRPEVTLTVKGTTYTAKTLSGDTSAAEGKHRLYWNFANEGIASFGRGTISVTYKSAPYCVIDLSGGADATSYPITYFMSEPEDGFNTDEYKLTKLVLRRIEAGSFIMGDNQENEAHRVTLTMPFYMGLFEMTQKQWESVMGSNPSYFSQDGDIAPVENVSYNDIRGTVEGAKWPSSNAVDTDSFLGKLRAKTGLAFDLPTEAQWEYACRAGTTTTWSFGDDDSIAVYYMRYKGNSGNITGYVGRKRANPWGLYDMHGNNWEWCLDWYSDDLAYGTDPKGPETANGQRVLRGGGVVNAAAQCTSAFRWGNGPDCKFTCVGLRLTRTLQTTYSDVKLVSFTLTSGLTCVLY